MNSYFNSLGSTAHDPINQLPYDNDYNRNQFSTNFDRLTGKDPRMNNYSNLNMMGASSMPNVSTHPSNLHHEQNQNTGDYQLPFSHGPSSSMNDMRSQQIPNFSMAVTNPMLYYAHPWMRPGTSPISVVLICRIHFCSILYRI